MASVYNLISQTTLSSASSTVDLTSIPPIYRDLVIHISARHAGSSQQETMRLQQINGSTANLINRWMRGSGEGGSNFASADATDGIYLGQVPGALSASGIFSNVGITICTYRDTNYGKTLIVEAVQENEQTEAFQSITAGRWNNTSALTSLRFYAPSNFVTGSTFTLYGVGNS
jgi:hypothetical protein